MIRPGGPNQDHYNLKNFLGNSLWTANDVLRGGLTGDTRKAIESLAAEALRLHDVINTLSQRVAQLESAQRH